MRTRVALATLLVLLVPAAAAHASTYARVLHAYETTGTIAPCQFSSAQLETALKGVDTYGAQYFADFTNAIQGALGARAAGACGQGHPPVVSRPAGQAAHSADTHVPLGPVTAPTGAAFPAPILLMAALGAAFALLAALAGLARMRGWDPAWAQGWRHAWGEAGHRAGGTWSEFVDWLRSR